jgi:hypothetical protein
LAGEDPTTRTVSVTVSVTTLDAEARIFAQSLRLLVPADLVAGTVVPQLMLLVGNVGRAVDAAYPAPPPPATAGLPLSVDCFCGGFRHAYGTGPSCSVTAERP